MDLGHPGLVEKLVARIERDGPISFAAFMEAALYDPEFGYYMTAGPRIGLEGDYYTSLDVHPIFAELVGRQIAQAAEAIVPSGEFTIVEMGAGKGLLAKHLLNAYRRDKPDFLARLRYLLVERSPAMVETQKQRLLELTDAGVNIAWVPDLDAVSADSITGVFLSNELVDAFPVHRLVKRPLGLREIFVGWDGSRFIEIEAPPFSPDLEAYFARIGISLEVGQQAEVNLQALEWMRQVGTRLRRGLVVTIDYGHAAADLFAPARKTGTLLGYYRHTVSDSPYVHVGQQDLTAHVDFTSLALAGQDMGLEVTGFTNQLHFLIGLGIESTFADLDPESPQSAAMRELLRPDGMGTTYKILIQHKGMSAPQLDGLRSRPYFLDALRLPERRPGSPLESVTP
ncbi:MAG: SAM-dependent methyltransferase [Nitrospirae bacterium]|nr:MAG: SAM-dependent methyltransferase [Nitrospirota bacterium]